MPDPCVKRACREVLRIRTFRPCNGRDWKRLSCTIRTLRTDCFTIPTAAVELFRRQHTTQLNSIRPLSPTYDSNLHREYVDVKCVTIIVTFQNKTAVVRSVLNSAQKPSKTRVTSKKHSEWRAVSNFEAERDCAMNPCSHFFRQKIFSHGVLRRLYNTCVQLPILLSVRWDIRLFNAYLMSHRRTFHHGDRRPWKCG